MLESRHVSLQELADDRGNCANQSYELLTDTELNMQFNSSTGLSAIRHFTPRQVL